MTPSTLNIRPGGATAFNLYALREDGFNGEIKISLKDAPEGFVLSGDRLPEGKNNIRMSLTAPRDIGAEPIKLHLIATAEINGKIISHEIIPCEDMMQAFLYRHLVPSQELFAAGLNARWIVPPIEPNFSNPVKIKSGTTTQIIFKTANRPAYERMKFELNSAPEGLTLQDVNVAAGKLIFNLKADEKIKKGLCDNLIIDISIEVEQKQNRDKQKNQKMVNFGVIPAIPITVE
jgi:hypothetical protein